MMRMFLAVIVTASLTVLITTEAGVNIFPALGFGFCVAVAHVLFYFFMSVTRFFLEDHGIIKRKFSQASRRD